MGGDNDGVNSRTHAKFGGNRKSAWPKSKGVFAFEGGLPGRVWGTKVLLLLAGASRLLCPLDTMSILSILTLYQSFRENGAHVRGLRGVSVFFVCSHG